MGDGNPCKDYFSGEEIRQFKGELKKGKGSIGPFNDHLRKVPGEGLDRGLQMVCNYYWHFSYIPVGWRESTLTSVLKNGDDRYAWKPGNYRGIVQGDTGRRLFERYI